MRPILQGKFQMHEVKVKCKELLEKIKKNRFTHIIEYKQAVEGYKQAAIAKVEDKMQYLKRQINQLKEGEMIQLASVTFTLAVPQNHEQDYDQVIEMLEMSVDDTITIKANEFACYVMDDWDWKADFLNTSNIYKNR